MREHSFNSVLVLLSSHRCLVLPPSFTFRYTKLLVTAFAVELIPVTYVLIDLNANFELNFILWSMYKKTQ